MREELKVKHGIPPSIPMEYKNCYINDYSEITRIDIALKIYVELIRSASDKGALLETNIDKNIALIAFKFTDTFIEGSKTL